MTESVAGSADHSGPPAAWPVVRGPAGAAPFRPASSVRRTSTIDMRWPGGWGSEMQLLGRARDLFTAADGSWQVLAADEVRVGVASDRTITSIETDPVRSAAAGLVGARGGGGLRRVLAELFPAERDAGTPLYLLLDDLSGATLIGGFAYSQWPSQWPEGWHQTRSKSGQRAIEGICAGFAPGASSLQGGDARFSHDLRPVPPLVDPADLSGWHHLEDIAEVSMRRARRIDVTVDSVIRIDAMFQDSATVPAGGRVAVHEYLLQATADPLSGEVLTISADPRVLPFQECPMAAANVHRIVGIPLADLRSAVLQELKGTVGCTHLNDALRALAEVPTLRRQLESNQ
jgi:Protein of unknown function (DUF2889)